MRPDDDPLYAEKEPDDETALSDGKTECDYLLSDGEGGHGCNHLFPDVDDAIAYEPPDSLECDAEFQLKMWREIPPEDATGPRDNRVLLHNSADGLFIFQLLSLRGRGGKRVAVFRDGEQLTYRVLDASGQPLHPMTGLPCPPPAGAILKNEIHMRRIASYARSFWQFRELGTIGARNETKCSLAVDNIMICGDGKPNTNGIAKAILRWPGWALNTGDDAILDHLQNLTFADLRNGPRVIRKKNMAFCPIDGLVPVICGVERSHSRTWAHFCGMEFSFALCSKCLGVFESKMSMMN